MAEQRAIHLALDLLRMPALAPVMRRQALPSDLLDAIRVASGCPEALETALATTCEPVHVIRAAAAFYLQEMLFFPGASPHRNLGVMAGASKAQTRLHMRWLLRWLHPDHNSDEMATLLAKRVIKAWRDIASDTQERPISQRSNPRKRHGAIRLRWVALPLPPSHRARLLSQLAVVVFLAAIATLVLIVIPDVLLFGRLPFLNNRIIDVSTAMQRNSINFVEGTRR